MGKDGTLYKDEILYNKAELTLKSRRLQSS